MGAHAARALRRAFSSTYSFLGSSAPAWSAMQSGSAAFPRTEARRADNDGWRRLRALALCRRATSEGSVWEWAKRWTGERASSSVSADYQASAARVQIYVFHARESEAYKLPHFPAASSRFRSCNPRRGSQPQVQGARAVAAHRRGRGGQELVRATRTAALIHDDERVIHAARPGGRASAFGAEQ